VDRTIPARNVMAYMCTLRPEARVWCLFWCTDKPGTSPELCLCRQTTSA